MNLFFNCEHYIYFSSLFILYIITIDAENLALNKDTRQSGTYYDGSILTYASSLAVDGDRNQNAGIFPGCSHAMCDLEWWAVDLGDTYVITRLTIYGRNDHPNFIERLSEFSIEVISQPCGQADELNWDNFHNGIVSLCHHQINPVDAMDFTCPNLIGRFVRIRYPIIPNCLSLCEVEVYGLPTKASGMAVGTKQPKETFHVLDGQRVNTTPYLMQTTRSKIECSALCKMSSTCTASNFNKISHQCELMEAVNHNCPFTANEEWKVMFLS